MVKNKTIDVFFKRKSIDKAENSTSSKLIQDEQHLTEETEEHPSKLQKIGPKEVDVNALECDLGSRPQIWEYPSNQRDEIRSAYLKMGPYQIHLENYPLFSSEKHPRKFSTAWFRLFHS